MKCLLLSAESPPSSQPAAIQHDRWRPHGGRGICEKGGGGYSNGPPHEGTGTDGGAARGHEAT